MQSERRVKALFLAGLFLVCMCGLMLQIMETVGGERYPDSLGVKRVQAVR